MAGALMTLTLSLVTKMDWVVSFDDGPDPYTLVSSCFKLFAFIKTFSQVLDSLSEAKINATFFIVGMSTSGFQ